MKRALVCGAGGFIGSHLVKRLKNEGYWVRGVDQKQPQFSPTAADEFLQLDLREREACGAALALPSSSFDEVYQLAADMGGMGFIHAAECEIMRNSALVNINVIDAAARTRVGRYFFSSSVCIYRDMAPGEPALTEEQAYPALPLVVTSAVTSFFAGRGETLRVVVVNAAGNDSSVGVPSRVPATYPEVFAIASTTVLKGTTSCKLNSAIIANAASWYTTDGKFDPTTKIGITISAPGEDSETVTLTCGISSVGMVTLQKGGGTMRASGTSISAPLVAGVVARLIQKGNTGVENIRSILRSTAQLVGTAPNNSPYVGYTFDGEREGIAKAP